MQYLWQPGPVVVALFPVQIVTALLFPLPEPAMVL